MSPLWDPHSYLTLTGPLEVAAKGVPRPDGNCPLSSRVTHRPLRPFQAPEIVVSPRTSCSPCPWGPEMSLASARRLAKWPEPTSW